MIGMIGTTIEMIGTTIEMIGTTESSLLSTSRFKNLDALLSWCTLDF